MKGSTLVAFLCFSCAECHKGLLASEESPEFSARVKHLTLDKCKRTQNSEMVKLARKLISLMHCVILFFRF